MFEQLFIESCLNDDLSCVSFFLAVFEQLFVELCLNDDIALYS